MDLARHGLRIVERRVSNFLPLPGGDHLIVGEGRTKAEVARFSKRDAGRLDAYGARLEAIADVLRDLVLETPPNMPVGSGAHGHVGQLLAGRALAAAWRSSI